MSWGGVCYLQVSLQSTSKKGASFYVENVVGTKAGNTLMAESHNVSAKYDDGFPLTLRCTGVVAVVLSWIDNLLECEEEDERSQSTKCRRDELHY